MNNIAEIEETKKYEIQLVKKASDDCRQDLLKFKG